MPARNVKGVGVRTASDEARRLERLALQEQWARVDAMLDDALHDAATIIPTSTNEVS